MSETEQAIMPDEKGAYSAADLAERYDFSGCQTPEGFDPHASGYRDCPVGLHIMRVDLAASKMMPNQEFKDDQQSYVLNQFRPALRVVGGRFDGASAMDFLPMPTKGAIMSQKLANKWANFIRAFGFEPTTECLTPSDFTLTELAKRTAQVDIRIQVDRDKQPKKHPDGRPMLGPAWFGYSRVPTGASGAQQSLPGATMSHAAPPAKAPPTPPDEIEL